ncbi:MAG: hypothetical protein R6U26_00825 [Candidatus Undinarchaeales archaeon]
MALIRELESKLRSIRRVCKSAIDPTTGAVDATVIHQQAAELKQWISNFENMYIREAREHPNKAKQITADARDFINEAWFTYEVLIELSMKADEPPPSLVKWEVLPSGVVPGKLKEQAIKQLDKIYEDFTSFRKEVLVS